MEQNWGSTCRTIFLQPPDFVKVAINKHWRKNSNFNNVLPRLNECIQSNKIRFLYSTLPKTLLQIGHWFQYKTSYPDSLEKKVMNTLDLLPQKNSFLYKMPTVHALRPTIDKWETRSTLLGKFCWVRVYLRLSLKFWCMKRKLSFLSNIRNMLGKTSHGLGPSPWRNCSLGSWEPEPHCPPKAVVIWSKATKQLCLWDTWAI